MKESADPAGDVRLGPRILGVCEESVGRAELGEDAGPASFGGRLVQHQAGGEQGDQEPDRRLQLVGVTGTNGKTTTALLVAAIVEAAGGKLGFIGTLGSRIGTGWLANQQT